MTIIMLMLICSEICVGSVKNLRKICEFMESRKLNCLIVYIWNFHKTKETKRI